MKPRPPADCHVELRTALDYLDGTLDASGQREVESHLGTPCPVCRERVRELGALIHRMRLDRVPPVPEVLHARARAVFAAGDHAAAAPPVAERIARLLFDSWVAPRLRFAFEGGTLELECETESPGLAALRGRLVIEDAPLHRVVVTVGAESQTAWPGADGTFALDQVPAGEARVLIDGPGTRFRLPPIAL